MVYTCMRNTDRMRTSMEQLNIRNFLETAKFSKLSTAYSMEQLNIRNFLSFDETAKFSKIIIQGYKIRSELSRPFNLSR